MAVLDVIRFNLIGTSYGHNKSTEREDCQSQFNTMLQKHFSFIWESLNQVCSVWLGCRYK